MSGIKQYIQIVEAAHSKIVLDPLPYDRAELEPVLSKETIDYHYGKLAKGYVDRYNKGEGDLEFNQKGALLHNIFFSQLMPPKSTNRPVGSSQELIDSKHKSFDKFKQSVEDVAKTIKGSGWIYMDNKGLIHTIPNHEYKNSMKIALLIDFWEHAWALDYQEDKFKYLNNFWRIVNWSIVNNRLQ
jgi:Fe-Mn family superoxide dismutase